MVEGATGNSINGLRVLVVEDESLVTMLIEDTLANLGCTVVGVASRVDEAMRKAEALAFDAAILDVNLNGSETFPVAEMLIQKGIPFVFSTGYSAGSLPEMFRDVPNLGKPFRQSDLARTLTAAVEAR